MGIEINSRWRLKKINADVPLYDASKKVYSIIVDDALVEIPEEIFLKLFNQYESPYDIQEEKIDFEQYNVAKLAEEILKNPNSSRDIKEEIKSMLSTFKNFGFKREQLSQLLLNYTLSRHPYMNENSIKEELNKLFDDVY